MRIVLAAAALFVGLSLLTAVHSQDTLPPAETTRPQSAPAAGGGANFRQQVSYALGRNFALSLRQSEIEVDPQVLLSGVSDALAGTKPKFTDDECHQALIQLNETMQQKAEARNQQDAVKNAQAAQAFLAQNAKREGVQTTASGLQYRVLRQGDGPSPTLTDVVSCHYRGLLLDGTEFDSSAGNGGPAEFPVRGVIPGWTEALQKMKVGDKWQLFVPPQLAYGTNPPGPPIEANSLLVFEIELLGVSPQ